MESIERYTFGWQFLHSMMTPEGSAFGLSGAPRTGLAVTSRIRRPIPRLDVWALGGGLEGRGRVGGVVTEPLPPQIRASSGSRWPRFPAFSGTIRALRLPAPACPSAHCFRQPAPRVPAGFVSALGGRSRRRTGLATDRGLDFLLAFPLQVLYLPTGKEQDLPGSLAIHPRDFVPVYDPGRPVAPRR